MTTSRANVGLVQDHKTLCSVRSVHSITILVVPRVHLRFSTQQRPKNRSFVQLLFQHRNHEKRIEVHKVKTYSRQRRPTCPIHWFRGMRLVGDTSSKSECTHSLTVDLIMRTCRDETVAAPGMADQEPDHAALEAVETIERAQSRRTATRGPSKVRSQLRRLPEFS